MLSSLLAGPVLWYSNRRRCGAWPLFFSPCCRFAPVLGLGLLRRPDGCCRSPARCLAGFSSLGWLAGCSPGSLSFYFRAACFLAGCLGFYASFPPGEGSWFLRLAWRYGCRFWRRSLPLPMVFPWRWGHGVRLYLLGWFAILEVLVLKSRVSPFLMVSSLLAWCLEFWAPVPVAPLPRGALWFFSSFCGVRVLHRTSGLVRRSLCSLSTCLWPGLCGFGVIHVWVFSGSPSAVRVLCPLLRRVDVARQDLPCSSVGGLHCPGPVNARKIAWENVFNLV